MTPRVDREDSTVSDPDALRQELEQHARAMGIAVFGVADLDALQREAPALLERVPGDFRRAVVIAR